MDRVGFLELHISSFLVLLYLDNRCGLVGLSGIALVGYKTEKMAGRFRNGLHFGAAAF